MSEQEYIFVYFILYLICTTIYFVTFRITFKYVTFVIELDKLGLSWDKLRPRLANLATKPTLHIPNRLHKGSHCNYSQGGGRMNIRIL